MQPTRRKPKKLLIQIAVAAVVAVVIGFLAVGGVLMVISNISTVTQQEKEKALAEAEKAKKDLERLQKLRTQNQTPTQRQKMKEVQALVDISPGEPITQAALTVVELEGGMPSPGALTKVSDVVGKVAIVPILAGEVITPKKLMQSENLLRVPEGMRAITVSLDSVSSLDGALLPGSYVDVLMTMRDKGKSSPDSKDNAITRTLLQNIQVIAIGTGGPAAAMAGRSSGGGNGVTVLVTPAQAEMLALAQEQSKLSLTLRNFKDKTKVRVGGADTDVLITGINPESLKRQLPTPPKVPANLVQNTSAHSDIVPVNYSPQALPEPSNPEAASKNKFTMKVYAGSGSETVEFEQ